MKRDVADLVEATVREHFTDVSIDAVRVREEIDHEGDAFFRVIVVVQNKAGSKLDVHKTAGIARHIRHKLLEVKETALPIFTFVTKSDAAGMKAEAA